MCSVGMQASDKIVVIAPQVQAVVPNQGLVTGGALITVVGAGLGSGSDITAVTLAGISATIVSQTVNQVVVQSGAVNVAPTVTAVVVYSTSRGTATMLAGFQYIAVGVPLVLSAYFSPTGTVVTVTPSATTNMGGLFTTSSCAPRC